MKINFINLTKKKKDKNYLIIKPLLHTYIHYI